MWEYFINNADSKLVSVIALFLLWDLRKSFRDMADSIRILTAQMAAIVERVDGHEKRIDRLEG